MEFKADEIFADYDENGLLIIAFSGKTENESIYLMIQDAFDRNDEQEIELGMNTFYIEINDQSKSGYGGISEIELCKNLLSIKLNETGKKNLKVENKRINIGINISEKEFVNLTEKLKVIFEPEKKIITTYNTV